MRGSVWNRPSGMLSAALLLAVGLTGGTLVQAEVVGSKDQPPAPKSPVIHDEPVALECWQEGRRIIQRDGLKGLAVKAVTRKGAVAFKQQDGNGPDIFLLPFDDGLCLIAPEE